MSGHTVKAFDDELSELRSLINSMGRVVLQQLHIGFETLRLADNTRSEQAIRLDRRVDTLFHDSEESAVRMIAERQPVAGDLRTIMASVKIAKDLERAGDLARNTVQRSEGLIEAKTQLTAVIIPLVELAWHELRNVMNAYITMDAEAAYAVWRRDQELDNLHDAAFRELLTYMLENPRSIGTCTHLLFVAKNMERIGDHATNIAEQICYLVEGRTPLGHRPKKSDSRFTST